MQRAWSQRVRELLVQASNGTYNQGDLNSIATEVTQLTETLKQDANTQYAGQYVFSGTLTTTAPYKQGAEDDISRATPERSRARSARARRSTSTRTSPRCSATARAPPTASCSTRCARSPSTCAAAPPKSKAALNSTDLKNLDANIETLTQLQATTGSATDQLNTASTRIETLQTLVTKTLSNTAGRGLRQDDDRLLQRAGRATGRAARRREHRSGIAAELPALEAETKRGTTCP